MQGEPASGVLPAEESSVLPPAGVWPHETAPVGLSSPPLGEPLFLGGSNTFTTDAKPAATEQKDGFGCLDEGRAPS